MRDHDGSLSELSSARYARLATFTKDGRRKETGVWIADLGDGTVGIAAEAGTWKVKRIRNTPAVGLAVSDGRGLVEDGTPELTGTARVVTGPEYAPVEAALLAKYGLQFRLFRGFAKIGRRLGWRQDLCGIIISPG